METRGNDFIFIKRMFGLGVEESRSKFIKGLEREDDGIMGNFFEFMVGEEFTVSISILVI